MTIKIVTDSSCDIPGEIAQELDITVVPLYVQVGTKTYKDGVDISPDQVMTMLEHENVIPTTAAASPNDFAETYRKLCSDSQNIISVHLSGKVSGTLDAARKGKEMVEDEHCRIEVVDSRLATMGVGLVAIAAARAAGAGQSIQDIIEHINKIIPSIHVYGMLDSLKYVARGGRLGKVVPLLSSVLTIRPLLTMKDGMVTPMGVARTRNKGIDRICEIIKSACNIKEIGISHSTMEGEIKIFSDRLKSMAPGVIPIISKLGPALGVHGGPGSILVAIQQELSAIETVKKPLVTLPSLQSIKDNLAQRMQKDTPRTLEYAYNRIQM